MRRRRNADEEEKKRSAMIEQRFPPAWHEQRVERLLAELDSRTEEEWVAADDAAAADGDDQTVVTLPSALLPEFRRMLAKYAAAHPNQSDDQGTQRLLRTPLADRL